MLGTDELLRRANVGLAAVQELQQQYDAVGWQISEPNYAKARHVLLHLIKITSRLAALVEHVEHVASSRKGSDLEVSFAAELGQHRDIAAHLLFHSAQLANLAEADLTYELATLYRANATT